MKIIMAFLFMSVLFCGCSRRAETRIVGTWISKDGNGRITYYDDAHFVSNWHYSISDSNIYNGTWQIADDNLTATVTSAAGTGPHEQAGSVDHFKISRLNDDELVYSDVSHTNAAIAFTREK